MRSIAIKIPQTRQHGMRIASKSRAIISTSFRFLKQAWVLAHQPQEEK